MLALIWSIVIQDEDDADVQQTKNNCETLSSYEALLKCILAACEPVEALRESQ